MADTRLEELLRQILDISTAQQRLIREANTDALGRNLERRQACIDELADLPDLKESYACSAEARQLYAEIQALEKQNFALMETEMGSFREKMRKNTEARKLGAYFQAYTPDAQGGHYNKKQ